MAKRFMCNACNKSCASEATYSCEQTCSDCMASPPCAFSAIRIPCAEYNRYFRSQTCFANPKQNTSYQRCCSTCVALLSGINHDCSIRYYHTCKQNRATGHLCYLRPLKDVLPPNADNVYYIFYDFQATQMWHIPTRPKHMYLTFSACSSFARDVRKSTIVVSIVIGAVGEGTHFDMIL